MKRWSSLSILKLYAGSLLFSLKCKQTLSDEHSIQAKLCMLIRYCFFFCGFLLKLWPYMAVIIYIKPKPYLIFQRTLKRFGLLPNPHSPKATTLSLLPRASSRSSCWYFSGSSFVNSVHRVGWQPTVQ